MLTLLSQRLLIVLPGMTKPALWAANDSLRALGYAALAAWVLAQVPWSNLRAKCLTAAILGYAAADVLVCLLWYGWHLGGYRFACTLQLIGFGGAAAFYWWRSYRVGDERPGPDHIYCLRHRPAHWRDLAISMLGFFGPSGGYAIYCDGWVYKFRKGKLIRVPYDERSFLSYHSVRGAPAERKYAIALDAMVGKTWRVFGSNCLTTLGSFWGRYGRRR